jgi:glutamate--cysteine ligase
MDVDGAHEHVERTALRPSAGGQVGLELEFHLVDLADPGRRPSWANVCGLVDVLPPLPCGSRVTVEPGGQLELSTPPRPDVVAAVTALRADRGTLTAALRAEGYGTAPLGTDPARPAARINPGERYRSMERHFTAIGCAEPGRTMMTATAALQVNVDAGPESGWSDRLGRIRRLGPVLVAASACSPLLAGRASGWHSMRQQAWHGIDARRSGPVLGTDPRSAWATYALDAPLMLVHDPDTGRLAPLTEAVPFRSWLRAEAGPRRRPTPGDLDYHLTTLFPPIRPRGYVEIRCLDALPDRWWPALAALTVTLIDDPIASERADELCQPVGDAWTRAARDGLGDPALHRAAAGCAALAAERCLPDLRAEVARFAELLASGRTPGDELRERADAQDPLTALEEEAHA